MCRECGTECSGHPTECWAAGAVGDGGELPGARAGEAGDGAVHGEQGLPAVRGVWAGGAAGAAVPAGGSLIVTSLQ